MPKTAKLTVNIAILDLSYFYTGMCCQELKLLSEQHRVAVPHAVHDGIVGYCLSSFCTNSVAKKMYCILLCRGLLVDMRKSRKHRLISRTSELFADDPELPEPANTTTDVSVLVASQLGMPTPSREQKSRCSVLFCDKKANTTHELVDQLLAPQNSNVMSTVVSEYFEIVYYIDV